MASYGTVIEYFSKGKIDIEHVLSNYIEKFEIFPTPPEVYYFKKKHGIIYNHFHEYCEPKDMRDFIFIKMLHEKNDLNTSDYCKIEDYKASLDVIDNNNKDLIRNYLINHDALAIVLYKVREGGKVIEGKYHAVTIGVCLE